MSTALLACKVATRLLVAMDERLVRVTFKVTVSPGSMTSLVGRQLSATSKAAPVTIGVVAEGANALIKLVPFGVPQPVQRSYPGTA